MNHNQRFHLFGLACFHAFELEEHGVSMDDFALTCGFTLTPELLLDLQDQYNTVCHQSTAKARALNGLEVASHGSEPSHAVEGAIQQDSPTGQGNQPGLFPPTPPPRQPQVTFAEDQSDQDEDQ